MTNPKGEAVSDLSFENQALVRRCYEVLREALVAAGRDSGAADAILRDYAEQLVRFGQAARSTPKQGEALRDDAQQLIASLALFAPDSAGHEVARVAARLSGLVNRLAAPPQQVEPGWQPIETAPKTGYVWLCSTNPDRTQTPVFGCWGDYCKYNQPGFTHWQSAPAPIAPKEPKP